MLSQRIFYAFTSIQNCTLIRLPAPVGGRAYQARLRLDPSQADVIAAAHAQRIANQAIGNLF